MPSDTPIPDAKVFEWLGNDSKQVPYYLHPLNLVWSKEGVEYDLKVYQRVAELLAEDTNYWAELIRSSSWRESLAGCTCLLVSHRKEFLSDLCYRFEAGGFVTPQIAVTIGLLHGEKAGDYFNSILAAKASLYGPKQVVSAQRCLLHLGVQPIRDIAIDIWAGFERDDATVADSIVSTHWNFWSSRT